MTRAALARVPVRPALLMKALLIFLIRAYQLVHLPFFRGSCRFYPTCSHYALEAVELHGPARGAWVALRRFVRCQPFCRGGFDPVPEPLPGPRAKLSTPPRGWSLMASPAPRAPH